MALRHESVNMGDRRRLRVSKKESAFRTHLAVYLGVGLFLFTLNLLTSPFELWFYWPMFFWGWCLVLHAAITYGTDAPSRVLEDLRSLVPWVGGASPVSSSNVKHVADPAPFAAEAFAAVHERIERLRELAWHIPDGPVRARAVDFCEAADQIAASMAADRADAETVRGFAADLLAPAESLFAHIVEVAGRHDPGASGELGQLAEHDLPLLRSRLDALSDTVPHEMPPAVPPMSVASDRTDAFWSAGAAERRTD